MANSLKEEVVAKEDVVVVEQEAAAAVVKEQTTVAQEAAVVVEESAQNEAASDETIVAHATPLNTKPSLLSRVSQFLKANAWFFVYGLAAAAMVVTAAFFPVIIIPLIAVALTVGLIAGLWSVINSVINLFNSAKPTDVVASNKPLVTENNDNSNQPAPEATSSVTIHAALEAQKTAELEENSVVEKAPVVQQAPVNEETPVHTDAPNPESHTSSERPSMVA